MATADASEPIRIGISSCLLGERVRFDGGHKRDAFLVGTLALHVTFVPVCPEFELGLGAPRESLRLVDAPGGPRLVAPASGTDHTEAMQRWARARAEQLAGLELCGYVLKKDSPSCGLERVRVHGRGGSPRRDGRGLFAAALHQAQPLLPLEEEGRLQDPELRESFLERVFAYRRLRDLFRARWTQAGLVAFHSREKLLLLAHHPESYRTLGRLVAGGKARDRQELRERYSTDFLRALEHRATRGRHANVLEHMLGYFKQHLCAPERADLKAVIADFQRGLVPLVVPVTLLAHHARLRGIEYLVQQSYLAPHPKELMLRNHG